MAETKTFSLLANVCRCFNVRKNAFSCWSRAWNKFALNSLNINREPMQQSQGGAGWSKNGPLSTVLRNVSESLRLMEKKRFEWSKGDVRPKNSDQVLQQNRDQVLQMHLQERQSEQRRRMRPYAAARPMEAEGGMRQRLVDLMKTNITQTETPLLSYDDLNLASKYARFVESHYDDYPAHSKAQRRVRNVCPSVEEQNQMAYRQEYVWNRKPPLEYTTLPESGWIRDQQSIKEQQRHKDQQTPKQQLRLEEQQANYREISGIDNKILRNDRIMRCIRNVEHNAHIPIDFKPQTYRHGYHWDLRKSQSDVKLTFANLTSIPKMRQQQKRTRQMAERKVTEKQQQPLPEQKAQRKVTEKQQQQPQQPQQPLQLQLKRQKGAKTSRKTVRLRIYSITSYSQRNEEHKYKHKAQENE
ncbi:putative uncharacterized protein DDB_G0271606 [Drosophila obscura]|uniref:putative uncharacterized protein DDB_G0271606 n=1 Tax=Drosophila obscura TaxID=7282 RepID=UPI001BB28028|nr:putative uncharacterized protein DDB_G0271606 [Drosophila obscura]